MGTDREMDAEGVEQRGCEGAGQARDRQTEGDWEQAWREDAGMIVERLTIKSQARNAEERQKFRRFKRGIAKLTSFWTPT